MWEPEPADIPDGCNIIGRLESSRGAGELAEVFQLGGWKTEPTDRGFELLMRYRRSGELPTFRIEATHTPAAASTRHRYVLSGQVEDPHRMAREIRGLFWQHDGRSNNLHCLWRVDWLEGVWRDVPATVERLGLDPGELSDEDRAAVGAGYLRHPVSDPGSSNPLAGLHFLVESVVADEGRVSAYFHYGGIHRLSWEEVRAVGAVGPGSGFSSVPVVRIVGDTRTLDITQWAEGFLLLLDRLARLPGFPMEEFQNTLDTQMWDGAVVVWERGVGAPVGPDPGH